MLDVSHRCDTFRPQQATPAKGDPTIGYSQMLQCKRCIPKELTNQCRHPEVPQEQDDAQLRFKRAVNEEAMSSRRSNDPSEQVMTQRNSKQPHQRKRVRDERPGNILGIQCLLHTVLEQHLNPFLPGGTA